MDCPAEATKWWSNLPTWILVLFGWWVVHWASLTRERRKEKRELSNRVVQDLFELEREAIDFHTANVFNTLQSEQLMTHIERLILSLQRQPMSELDVPLGKMIKLRRSITLNNADSEQFVAQSTNSNIVREIRSSIADLVDLIEAKRDQVWA